MLLLLLLSPGLRGASRWRILLVPTRAVATATFFWLALLPPGLAKAALPGDVTLWHYHLDHLGSVHSITDASGNLYRQTRYTAYGEVRGRYDGSANIVAAEAALRHEFTGYQSEETSGLQYAGARYYLPELGVFASHDPAGQFASPYAYGPGDPLNGTDPDGRFFGLIRALIKAVISFFKTLFKTGDVVAALGAAGIDIVAGLVDYAVASVTQSELAGAFVGAVVRASLQHAAYGYSTEPEREGSDGAQRAARFGRDLVDAAFGRQESDSGRTTQQVVSGQAKEPQIVRSGFESADAAGFRALTETNPTSIAENREYGGFIWEKDGRFGYTKPIPGDEISVDYGPSQKLVPRGATVLGRYHTHGDYSRQLADGSIVRTTAEYDEFISDDFSRQERINTLFRAIDVPNYTSYLGTPSGEFLAYRPLGSGEVHYILYPRDYRGGWK